MSDLSRYYAILGLEFGASPMQVKLAYRRLAKQWHPDRFIHDRANKAHAEAQFKQINEAYAHLKQHSPMPPPPARSAAEPTQGDRDRAAHAAPPPADPSSGNAQPPEPPVAASANPQGSSRWHTRRTDPKLFYDRGADLVKRGMYQESLDEFSMAIRLDPTYAEAYRYRGFVHSMLGFELGAEADLRKAKDLEWEAARKARAKIPRNPNGNPSSRPWS
jgi:COMPASS component SWD3